MGPITWLPQAAGSPVAVANPSGCALPEQQFRCREPSLNAARFTVRMRLGSAELPRSAAGPNPSGPQVVPMWLTRRAAKLAQAIPSPPTARHPPTTHLNWMRPRGLNPASLPLRPPLAVQRDDTKPCSSDAARRALRTRRLSRLQHRNSTNDEPRRTRPGSQLGCTKSPTADARSKPSPIPPG